MLEFISLLFAENFFSATIRIVISMQKALVCAEQKCEIISNSNFTCHWKQTFQEF